MAKISTFAAGTAGGAALLNAAAFAAALMMLALVSSAHAAGLGEPCTSAPENEWLSLEALQGKVEALGYKVHRANLKRASAEMYAIDKENGARLALFVDPTSGDIVRRLWVLP